MRHNPADMTATWDEFERLELRVGRITAVEELPGTRKPFHALTIDFGPLGTRRSAAQITHYPPEALLDRQVVCVLGFEPRRIAAFDSEVLVLGAMSEAHAVVLLRPDRDVEDGTSVA
jgi:tRNA-binding protein